MNTAIINLKVDPNTKKQAQQVAEELGLTLSAMINAYLKEVIRTKTVTYSARQEIPNAETIKAFQETEDYINSEEFKNTAFSNEETFAYLDQLIAREKADRQRQQPKNKQRSKAATQRQ